MPNRHAHIRSTAVATLLLLHAWVGEVSAQWTAGGVQVCAGCRGQSPQAATDGHGGAFVGWHGGLGETRPDVFLQRVLDNGTLAPGWPDSGIAISVLPQNQSSPAVISDGSAGVYLVWFDRRDALTNGTDIYASRVGPDGSIISGWLLNGTPVVAAQGTQSGRDATGDGLGGLYVVWTDERTGDGQRDVYAQRFLPDGSIAPGWQLNGIPISAGVGQQTSPECAADGGSGMFVVWTDSRDGQPDVYGTRVLQDGTLAPGWSPNGTLLAGGTTAEVVEGIAPDGEGGAYVGYFTGLSGSPSDEYTRDLFLLRITTDGKTAEGWPAGGIAVCNAPDFQGVMRMAPDGFGGVLALWHDFRGGNTDSYAVRILPDGTRAPGWPENGRPVVGPYSWPEIPRDIVADGDGGAYVAVETTLFPSLYAQHLADDGQIAPGWLPDGVAIDQTSGDDPRLVSDGAGGAIVVYQDVNTIYAQKLVPDGPVPVQLSLVASDVTSERVSLTWHVADGSIPSAVVYRRAGGADWRWVATIESDGSGLLRYEDLDVEPGASYGYRLGWAEDGREQLSTETWVEIPSAFTLQLAGFTPNPSTGPVTVSFTLPSAAPATLELLDVTGRRLISLDVGSLGPGQHLLRLDDGPARLSPGMYFVRLTAGGEQLISRGAIVR